MGAQALPEARSRERALLKMSTWVWDPATMLKLPKPGDKDKSAKKKKHKSSKDKLKGLSGEELEKKMQEKVERRADRDYKKMWTKLHKEALPSKTDREMAKSMREVEVLQYGGPVFETVTLASGETETVEVDAMEGPVLVLADDTKQVFGCKGWPDTGLESGWFRHGAPKWTEMSTTSKKIALMQVAKLNMTARA